MDNIKPRDINAPDVSKQLDETGLDTPGAQVQAPMENLSPADLEGAQLTAQLSRADLNDPVRREAAIDAALNDIMAERLDRMGLGPDAEGRRAVLDFMREDPTIREEVLAYLEQILT
jgi:hypothetical protein